MDLQGDFDKHPPAGMWQVVKAFHLLPTKNNQKLSHVKKQPKQHKKVQAPASIQM